MQNQTLEYYRNNCREFNDSTLKVDFRETQDRFLNELSASASILDFGCGSGRDTGYFLERGFKVTATDGSPEMCLLAAENTGHEIKQLLFQELDYYQEFDGIWACASIIIYTSFKYGSFEGMRNGRYFTDFMEDDFRKFLQDNSKMHIADYWITADVRPGRSDEKWLNLFLRN